MSEARRPADMVTCCDCCRRSRLFRLGSYTRRWARSTGAGVLLDGTRGTRLQQAPPKHREIGAKVPTGSTCSVSTFRQLARLFSWRRGAGYEGLYVVVPGDGVSFASRQAMGCPARRPRGYGPFVARCALTTLLNDTKTTHRGASRARRGLRAPARPGLWVLPRLPWA